MDVYHRDFRVGHDWRWPPLSHEDRRSFGDRLGSAELEGRLDGYSISVLICGRPTSVEEINMLMRTANQKPLERLLTHNDLPLVSSDFTHNSSSALFDAALTTVTGNGKHATVHAWCDNEWGFANRLIDNAVRSGALPLTVA